MGVAGGEWGPRGFALVTRAGCHLCDQMEAVLEDAGLDYARIDVDRDPALAARFGEVVPVLLRDGRPVAKVRLDAARLRRLMRRRRGP